MSVFSGIEKPAISICTPFCGIFMKYALFWRIAGLFKITDN
jgi:hypothetical protein